MSDRVLTCEAAARLLFNTNRPSAGQVAKVKEKIEQGLLARSPRGGLTTTASAVALYLSQKAAEAAANERPNARRYADGAPVPGVYQELLKDYFLAILLQRTARKRTKAFNFAVMAFQAAIILVPIVVFVLTYQSSLAAMIKSPAQVAIEEYLRKNYDSFGIESMEPVGDSDSVVMAKFWYAEKGSKRIQSQRYFTIADGHVTLATMGE